MSLIVAGRNVGPIGVGMMGLTRPGNVGKAHTGTEDSIATLRYALESGANFWDGGLIYGTPDYNSLHLLAAYFTKYPEDASKVVISIKACFDFRSGKCMNDAEGVQAQIEKCLEILNGKCRIDIFQPARLDPDIPIEVTIRAIAEFVKAGKIGGIGLSECSATSIRKAAAIHPIAAVEIEMSLFEKGPLTNGIAEACKEHNIPIIAYSPLGKGFLTGELRKYEDLTENDARRMFPRFQPENFDSNLKLVEEVEKIAQKKGCTVAQVAIAWVAAQTSTAGTLIMPIPGVTSKARVDENIKHVQLSSAELEDLDQLLRTLEVKGARHPERFQKYAEV